MLNYSLIVPGKSPQGISCCLGIPGGATHTERVVVPWFVFVLVGLGECGDPFSCGVLPQLCQTEGLEYSSGITAVAPCSSSGGGSSPMNIPIPPLELLYILPQGVVPAPGISQFLLWDHCSSSLSFPTVPSGCWAGQHQHLAGFGMAWPNHAVGCPAHEKSQECGCSCLQIPHPPTGTFS